MNLFITAKFKPENGYNKIVEKAMTVIRFCYI